ncbi:MAG: type II toxin-antitoxin system VapC family toxin, partial [Candidatus Hodarchaeales archaeon]
MFVDTVYWIAIKHSKDQWHQKALELKNQLLQSNKIYVTDFVIVETYNFLLRKISMDIAVETIETFLESERIEILFNDRLSLEKSYQILNKYNNLSLTDANIVWLSSIVNDQEILSFDSGFDGIP